MHTFAPVRCMQVNLARDATNVDLAEACWYQHTPEEADLVMIEYNLNACGYFTCSAIVAPQVSGAVRCWCAQSSSWHEQARRGGGRLLQLPLHG